MKAVDTTKLLPPFEELFHPDVLKNLILRPEAKKLAEKIGFGENLYIFIGSSGAGRDTVLDECLSKIKNAARLRRTTTRKCREQIKDTDRMIFITENQFLKDFEAGEILFAGRYKANNQLYGIGRQEISKLGKNPDAAYLLEENFSGLPLKVMFPKSKLIVVLPPTAEVLKERLFTRDKSEAECEKRFDTSLVEIKAVTENLNSMLKSGLVDMVIINDGNPGEVGQRVVGGINNNHRLTEDFSILNMTLKRYELGKSA